MAEAADRACSTLAYGDVKRVELAIALAGEPKLLLMDEPTAGMAPRERADPHGPDARRVGRAGSACCSPSTTWTWYSATRARARPRARRDHRPRLAGRSAGRSRGSGPPISGHAALAGGGRDVRMTLARGRGPSAAYGRAQVLFDLSFDLRAGEVVALVGRNGAGKSTTLKAILGLVRGGRGADLQGPTRSRELPTYRIARLGIGYVPEDRRIFADLTVAENLEVGRQPARAGPTPWTPERLLRLFPNLAEMRGRRGGQMSGGEQQMLAIARTLMGNPDAILLDEPSEGSPRSSSRPWREAMRAMKTRGRRGPAVRAELGLRRRDQRPRLRHRAGRDALPGHHRRACWPMRR